MSTPSWTIAAVRTSLAAMVGEDGKAGDPRCASDLRAGRQPGNIQCPQSGSIHRPLTGLPGLLQALQHNPQLLVLRPASATARLHDFEPAKMRTVRMAIHTHSAQPNRST